eukprot:g1594.t1
MRARSAAAAVGKRWAASGRWAPEAVARAMQAQLPEGTGTVQVKRSARAPTFMYSEGAHQRHLLEDCDKHHTLVEATPAEMVASMRAQDAENGPWYYFTAGCDSAFGEQCLQDGGSDGRLDGWGDLIHHPTLARQAGMQQAPPSVWIGGAGTTTAAHYDVMDNAFVQLHGRKRFRIWGPEALAALKVFPDLHPRARKTQLDMSSASVAALDLANEIVLEPGDVLHLPAFTFHQVEALDMSVSANVFSVCRSQLHGARILSLPVPVRSRSRPVSHASDTLAALAQRILPEFS